VSVCLSMVCSSFDLLNLLGWSECYDLDLSSMETGAPNVTIEPSPDGISDNL
jgi:hypothetical protein